MADEAQFVNCPVTTSRVQRASIASTSYKAVWVLEGLNDKTTLEQLIEQSRLNLEVGDGENEYNIQFGLQLDTRSTPNHDEEYISITADIAPYPETGTTFDIKIVSLSDSKPSINREELDVFTNQGHYMDAIIDYIWLLKKSPRTLPAKSYVPSYYATSKSGYYDYENTYKPKLNEVLSAQVEDLSKDISETYRLGIIVTPVVCNNVVNEPTTENLKSDLTIMSVCSLSDKSLSKDLEHLYLAGQNANYSDLKLETKDGAVISAHKFILAARCSVFRELIDMALKQNGFDGTIIIKNVNAKPLMALLHWMYTGKLQDGVEKFMGELVAAAALYEMQELLEMLDKELIKTCNKDNMFELFQTAKQNKMENAMKQISKFIKENI